MNSELVFRLSPQEYAEITRALRRLIGIFEIANSANGEDRFATEKRMLPNNHSPAPPSQGQAASAVRAASGVDTLEPRDRWSHDTTGKEIPRPDAECYTIRIWRCDTGNGKNGPFLDVRWNQKRAYCHDRRLFPWILEASRSKKQIIVYLEQKETFARIIGVKA